MGWGALGGVALSIVNLPRMLIELVWGGLGGVALSFVNLPRMLIVLAS